jgi:hypothetical protein
MVESIGVLTSRDCLVDVWLREHAGFGLGGSLGLHSLACITGATLVRGGQQCGAFPAEEEITVPSVSGATYSVS